MMQIKRLIIPLLLFAAHLPALSRLPSEFTISERVISLSATFDICTDLGPFAIARREVFSLAPRFDLEDPEGNSVASSKMALFSWGANAEIVDSTGLLIGRIKEELWRILPWAEYKIFNAENRLIAQAKMNVWGTHFVLSPLDNPGHVYATIERPFLRFFSDRWTVQIHDYTAFETNLVDPLLLIFLAVLQTDKDRRDHQRSSFLKQIFSE